MKFFRAVQLACAARAGDEVGVDRDLLARSTPRQELHERREVLELRDHLLYPHHDYVHGRNARDQPRVALVGDGADRARLGDPEVGPRDADVRVQELLPETLAGEGGQRLYIRRQVLVGDAGEDLRDPLDVHVHDRSDDVRGGVPGELGDPLSQVRLHYLQPEIGVVLFETVVKLDLLGRHALGLGKDLRPTPPRQIPDVADHVLAVFCEEHVSSAFLDSVGHLREVVVQVRHRLLLGTIRFFPQLRRVGMGPQLGVASSEGLAGEQGDRIVQLPVSDRLPAPLVEAFDLAFQSFPPAVLGITPARRLAGLHVPYLPSESSIWARCKTRVSCPVRRSLPPRCIRQLESQDMIVSAPLFSRAAIFSSAIAVETSGIFTENIPPNPQHNSSFSHCRSSRPETLCKRSRGSFKTPNSRLWWQPVWKTARPVWLAPRFFTPSTFTTKSENSLTRWPRASARSRSSGRAWFSKTNG